MQHYSANINVMLQATRKVARRLIRDFGELDKLQASTKGASGFVEIAHKKAEQIIIDELQKARPSYSIISKNENGDRNEDQEYRWIINPLDGITNFLHACPFFSISIALEKKVIDSSKNEIIAAVVDAPILGETYWAEKGGGAWLERHIDRNIGKYRLRVANRRSFADSLLAIADIDHNISHDISNFLTDKISIRVTGSSALNLAYMAAGRYDLVLSVNNKPADIAAGILLVSEAGGMIENIDHTNNMLNSNMIIAANDYLQSNFKALLVKKT